MNQTAAAFSYILMSDLKCQWNTRIVTRKRMNTGSQILPHFLLDTYRVISLAELQKKYRTIFCVETQLKAMTIFLKQRKKAGGEGLKHGIRGIEVISSLKDFFKMTAFKLFFCSR